MEILNLGESKEQNKTPKVFVKGLKVEKDDSIRLLQHTLTDTRWVNVLKRTTVENLRGSNVTIKEHFEPVGVCQCVNGVSLIKVNHNVVNVL